MSEHYCPAGKIECEYYCNEVCRVHDVVLWPEHEVCPWPSRQKPIVELVNPESYIKGVARGRADAVRECVKAVELVYAIINKSDAAYGPYMALDKAISAIHEVGENKEDK